MAVTAVTNVIHPADICHSPAQKGAKPLGSARGAASLGREAQQADRQRRKSRAAGGQRDVLNRGPQGKRSAFTVSGFDAEDAAQPFGAGLHICQAMPHAARLIIHVEATAVVADV